MFLRERCNYLGSGSKDVAKEIYFPLAVKTTVVPYLEKYLNRNDTLDVCGTAVCSAQWFKIYASS